MSDKTWPALIVKGKKFDIIATELLRDGRYNLVRCEDDEGEQPAAPSEGQPGGKPS